MTAIAERLAQLDSMTLLKGSHNDGNGKCAMEAAAWLAGEAHTDHPVCVSPVLGAFMRRWNDDLDDADRQMLKPYIARVLDTAGDGKDEIRGWMAADWLICVYTPAWLELAGINDVAVALRNLPEIQSLADLKASSPAISDARDKSAAARDAAWDAAAAAWDAAGKKLDPTKASLQKSALELLDRMIVA